MSSFLPSGVKQKTDGFSFLLIGFPVCGSPPLPLKSQVPVLGRAATLKLFNENEEGVDSSSVAPLFVLSGVLGFSSSCCRAIAGTVVREMSSLVVALCVVV